VWQKSFHNFCAFGSFSSSSGIGGTFRTSSSVCASGKFFGGLPAKFALLVPRFRTLIAVVTVLTIGSLFFLIFKKFAFFSQFFAFYLSFFSK
jgi:hypothetical protein